MIAKQKTEAFNQKIVQGTNAELRNDMQQVSRKDFTLKEKCSCTYIKKKDLKDPYVNWIQQY